MRMIELVLKSLNAISDLDYPNERYELIVVDNASNDGSFEEIRRFLDRKDNMRKKIVRLSKNLGFTGGNNIGFKIRDKESKYVILLNNDAVPFKESLQTMVEYAEQYNVAGLSGIILKHSKSNVIDTAGDLVDELLYSHFVGQDKRPPWIIRRPFYITYADGAYALYNVNSVLKTIGDKLFLSELWGYGDDVLLGLLLWNKGFNIIAIPEIVATHNRGSTFGKTSFLKIYLGERNRVALSGLTNVKYKYRIWIHSLRVLMSKIQNKDAKKVSRALCDGIRLSKLLRTKYNLSVNIYSAPILKITQEEFLKYYMAGTKERLVRHIESKIVKIIRELEVD